MISRRNFIKKSLLFSAIVAIPKLLFKPDPKGNHKRASNVKWVSPKDIRNSYTLQPLDKYKNLPATITFRPVRPVLLNEKFHITIKSD